MEAVLQINSDEVARVSIHHPGLGSFHLTTSVPDFDTAVAILAVAFLLTLASQLDGHARLLGEISLGLLSAEMPLLLGGRLVLLGMWTLLFDSAFCGCEGNCCFDCWPERCLF